ncbi:MAG: A24 family peptidase [Vicinamibacterales bacterium]
MDAAAPLAIIVAAIGAAIDVRTRRIPNALTLGGALAALAYFVYTSGVSGLGQSAAGWATGVGLFLPIFLLGGMGAGDVKLLGAVGAWLGPREALMCALYSILAGGILALIVAIRHRYFKQALRNVWGLIGFWRAAGIQPAPGMTLDDAKGPRLSYGAAILSGTVAAVFVR